MQFKKDNPQQALDLDKDKQQRIKEQLKEMAATHVTKEINDSLNFCMLTSIMTGIAMLDPEIITTIRERFEASIDAMKNKSNLLSIKNIDELSKIFDIPATIDQCALPYFSVIDAIRKAIEDAK